MIIYRATKGEFLQHARREEIAVVVSRHFRSVLGHSAGQSEVNSWRASLQEMSRVLEDEDIPTDASIAIEYQLPASSKRLDFVIIGEDAAERTKVLIIELKQWSESRRSEKDGLVWARRGGPSRETEGPHPSYQAWSYACLLRDFSTPVRDHGFVIQPCAYLHNHPRDGEIDHPHYRDYLVEAPLFLAEDRAKLQAFIREHVRAKDRRDALYSIEHGRIRPSKMLADHVAGLLQGRPEFILIDDQKVIYETILQRDARSTEGVKQVVIVEGGPGTGKSVVALNLLGTLLARERNARYVSKNGAPRAVYEAKLTGILTKSRISNLFSGSGSFINAGPDTFDTLIVDEAHRLNEKSGRYGNRGDNQVKELIRAAGCSVFFVDDDQRVTLRDIGSMDEIRRCAQEFGAEITELELASQFRCSGSDGYLAWLDNTLDIRATANPALDAGEYDFRVFDDPSELHRTIEDRNRASNRARMVAGYCWTWSSRKDPAAWDIEFPEFGYKRRWNLDKDGSLWIVAPTSVDQVGCIHTCQGLELDYVGVIIGPDLTYRDGKIVTDGTKRARSDGSVRGLKKMIKDDPEAAYAQADRIIKNTYRTLMTRGLKGCYIYCTDAPLGSYIRSRLRSASDSLRQQATIARTASHEREAQALPFRRVGPAERAAGVMAVPVVDLQFAAGEFSQVQTLDDGASDWVALPDWILPQPGLFVAQVIGESMNRRIPNGAWCLFREKPTGTRQNRVVVVRHRSIADPDTGGQYTVKVYTSSHVPSDDDTWRHERIILKPDSDDPGYEPIVLEPSPDDQDFAVIAEFLVVLDLA